MEVGVTCGDLCSSYYEDNIYIPWEILDLASIGSPDVGFIFSLLNLIFLNT